MSSCPEVELRKPVASDIDARFRLGFSSEILRMYGSEPGPLPEMTEQHAARWYEELVKHPCAWVITADSHLVGHVRLDDIDKNDHRARLAIGLLREDDLGRGIGRAATRLVLAHAFDVLKMHRVDLRVLSFNERAIRCYRACGFKHEGTERESAYVAGEWYDDWIMGILEQEYRAMLPSA